MNDGIKRFFKVVDIYNNKKNYVLWQCLRGFFVLAFLLTLSMTFSMIDIRLNMDFVYKENNFAFKAIFNSSTVIYMHALIQSNLIQSSRGMGDILPISLEEKKRVEKYSFLSNWLLIVIMYFGLYFAKSYNFYGVGVRGMYSFGILAVVISNILASFPREGKRHKLIGNLTIIVSIAILALIILTDTGRLYLNIVLDKIIHCGLIQFLGAPFGGVLLGSIVFSVYLIINKRILEGK